METISRVPSVFQGTDVEKCYQCGKCTAGCPVAEHMDFVPNRVLRLVQAGEIDEAMACAGIWHCVSCQTCTTRCPQTVDCAGVMDVLREEAAKKGVVPKDMQRVLTFQKAFLSNIRKYGRVNEVELIRDFKIIAFAKDFNVPLLIKDALLAPKLMQRGKFHLRGEKVCDRGVVERIFARCLDGKTAEGSSH